jgi:hypothetical protein
MLIEFSKQSFSIGFYVSVNLHLLVKNTHRVSYIDGCLDLVPCEYPKFNTSLANRDNCFSTVVLERIFNSCSPYQLKIILYQSVVLLLFRFFVITSFFLNNMQLINPSLIEL